MAYRADLPYRAYPTEHDLPYKADLQSLPYKADLPYGAYPTE
jgi:hypothetical protein